jgi:hypothetical protein
MERRLEDGTIVTFSYEKIGGATHVYVLDVDVPQAYGSAYTLMVAPEHTLIVACTEAQDWSIEVDAEDYGFDISYPDHEETLRQIFEEMFGEFVA